MSGQKAITWNRITNTAMPTLSILRRLFAAIRIKITLRLDNILENNISVVIPVYKAAAFVTRAVESAIEQPETAEVILIEDGSDDNSFEVCTSLVEKYNKVKLYRHPGNANKGAGLSRNLGIEKSSGEYIAFLDADDYFLPERFTAERILFAKDKTIDGVYGALGFHYYSEEGKRKYKERGYDELTTISSRIPSAEVPFSFIHLHDRARGQFHLDTLTLKKEVFAGKTEWFNSYAMHEDTAFLVQLSINCRLEPGIIDRPVAMYGVHDHNRIINNDPKNGSRILYWKYLYDWSGKHREAKRFKKLFGALLMREKLFSSQTIFRIPRMMLYSMRNSLFLRKAVFFRTASLHVFGKKMGWYCINFKEQVQQKYFRDDVRKTVFEEFMGATKTPVERNLSHAKNY